MYTFRIDQLTFFFLSHTRAILVIEKFHQNLEVRFFQICPKLKLNNYQGKIKGSLISESFLYFPRCPTVTKKVCQVSRCQ